MPFTQETKNPGDLIRAVDWNAAMSAIVALFAKLHETTGHAHTGAVEDGPKITTTGLADSAVTTQKVADAAITAAKIAAGVVPRNIGVAVTMGLTNGMSIPVPAGFARSECIFLAALKFVNPQSGESANVSADANGVLTVTENAVAVAAAFGKKGGWV